MFTSRNPKNPYHSTEVEWDEPPPPAKLRVMEDHSKGILSRNRSEDVPFGYSVNAYRGCTHACAYCYARRTHEMLDLGAGEDFERTIVIKPKAPELLKFAFERKSWKGDLVVFSGVTDCYQPLERRYRLTRQCLEVCAAYQNPVAIITRSPLVTRDVDVLRPLAALGAARVQISLPLGDEALIRALEPGAPPLSARLKAIEALAAAEIPVGVSLAPLIPGLNDHLIAESLRRASEAGARFAFFSMLRLPGSVREVFETRLRQALPLRAEAVLDRLSAVQRSTAIGQRMHGRGPMWDVARQNFEIHCRKYGLNEARMRSPKNSPFRRPGRAEQLSLFRRG